jgi:hypothetical protein
LFGGQRRDRKVQLRQFARADIPQKAFINMLKMDGRKDFDLAWFKRKSITERTLTQGEAVSYSKGFDDGVKMVIEKLSDLDPNTTSEETRRLIRNLILAHAFEESNEASDL